MKKTNTVSFIEVGILVGLAAVMFFWQLGTAHLTNWDEAWYADVSRTMAATGEYMKPVWNTRPFYEKPPLYFWLSSGAYLLFEDEELAARFFSAVSAVGVIFLCYALGTQLWGRRSGIASAIVTLSTVGFLFRARTGNMDATFAFFILATIYTLYKSHQDKRSFWIIGMGISIAGAFLTKGILAFVFPALCLIYFFIKRVEGRILSTIFTSTIIAVGIVCLWISADVLLNNGQWVYGILFHQVEKVGSTGNVLSYFSHEYIGHLKSGMKYWFLLFIPSFCYFVYKLKNDHAILIALFFIIFFSGLSIIESKSNWFLMPLYPVVGLVIGYAVGMWGKNIGKIAFVGVVSAVGLVQLFVYFDQYIVPDVSAKEASIASYAGQILGPSDALYLTNYYYPTAAYYSNRTTYAVYSEHDNTGWWVKRRDSWPVILEDDPVYIITTDDQWYAIGEYVRSYEFEELFREGDTLLLKKI